VDGEGGSGFFKRTAADRYIPGDDNGGAGGAVFKPGNRDATEEQNRRDSGGGEIKLERAFESRSPLAECENHKAEPKGRGGEQGPFVQSEFAENALSPAGGKGRTLDLIASELEVGADVWIAWGQIFGLTIEGDGFADLAGFEVSVAEVVVERDGFLAGIEDVFVSGDGIGEFAAVVKFVGGVEGGGRIGGAAGKRKRKEKESDPGVKECGNLEP